MTYTIKTAQNEWEIVCGLEIHCQIISKSKIFSGAPAPTKIKNGFEGV